MNLFLIYKLYVFTLHTFKERVYNILKWKFVCFLDADK